MLKENIGKLKKQVPENYKSLYYDYKLANSLKYILTVILITALFNITLLLPDMILIDYENRPGVLGVRLIFTLILLGEAFSVNKIRTFRLFSYIVTLSELFYLFIYFFVLVQYKNPDYLIQALGIVVFIIAVFIIPNLWGNMFFVAILSFAGFLVCAYYFIPYVEPNVYWAALVYLSLSILLCAVSAWNTYEHQLSEFLAKKELEYLSSTDSLTKTANRIKMEKEAKFWMDSCRRRDKPLALVFFDVDNLKMINDRYGHNTGDYVLGALTGLVSGYLTDKHMLARWGGDEFVLLLPETAEDGAACLSEKIRQAIEKDEFLKSKGLTCSFGVAEMKEASDFDSLLSEADALMYKGKKQGKDSVQKSEA